MLIILFWMIVASIHFYRNVAYKYKIGEMLPFVFSVVSINFYIMCKMIISGIMIVQSNIDFNSRWDDPNFLLIVQFVMIIVGVIFVMYSTVFYIAVGPLLFENSKDIIFTHIEGNTILFENFL